MSALLAQVAAASPSPDVGVYLAPAPGTDWVETGPTTDALVGVITPQSYGAWAGDNGQSEQAMHSDGFVTGYGRSWVQRGSQDSLREFVLAFNGTSGATHWYNDLKTFDETSRYYTKDIATLSTSQAVGVEWTYSDGGKEYSIDFAKGNLAFDVTMDSDSNDLSATTLAQAQSEFDAVPQAGDVALTSNTNLQPAAWAIGIALIMFVVLLSGGLFVLIRSARQKTVSLAYAPGAQMSPDGHYWWDGTRWRLVANDPPPKIGS